MTYHCHACRWAPLTEAALIEHIQTCEKHPLASALRSNAALSEVLRGYTESPSFEMLQTLYHRAVAVLASHGVVPVSAPEKPTPNQPKEPIRQR